MEFLESKSRKTNKPVSSTLNERLSALPQNKINNDKKMVSRNKFCPAHAHGERDRGRERERFCLTWGYIPQIQALERLSQEEWKFKTSQPYTKH